MDVKKSKTKTPFSFFLSKAVPYPNLYWGRSSLEIDELHIYFSKYIDIRI